MYTVHCNSWITASAKKEAEVNVHMPMKSTNPICTRGGEGGTLGIFGWGGATGKLESLAYTRASSSEFCYPVLDLTP